MHADCRYLNMFKWKTENSFYFDKCIWIIILMVCQFNLDCRTDNESRYSLCSLSFQFVKWEFNVPAYLPMHNLSLNSFFYFSFTLSYLFTPLHLSRSLHSLPSPRFSLSLLLLLKTFFLSLSCLINSFVSMTSFLWLFYSLPFLPKRLLLHLQSHLIIFPHGRNGIFKVLHDHIWYHTLPYFHHKVSYLGYNLRMPNIITYLYGYSITWNITVTHDYYVTITPIYWERNLTLL